MADRPIIFSGSMVNAVLGDRKTATRRVLNPQPIVTPSGEVFVGKRFVGSLPDALKHLPRYSTKRYGEVGDRLWVRETVRAEELPSGMDGVRYKADQHWQRIDNTREAADAWLNLNHYGIAKRTMQGNWAPAIHMPRWASRALLEILELRVHRIQGLTNADCLAEGVCPLAGGFGVPGLDVWGATPYEAFKDLWTWINGQKAWDENPYVLAIIFRRLKGAPDGEPLRDAGGPEGRHAGRDQGGPPPGGEEGAP